MTGNFSEKKTSVGQGGRFHILLSAVRRRNFKIWNPVHLIVPRMCDSIIQKGYDGVFKNRRSLAINSFGLKGLTT